MDVELVVGVRVGDVDLHGRTLGDDLDARRPGVDTEADVVYIADQGGNPIAMDEVFRSGSSTAKKAYKKELGKILNPSKRDTKQSTLAERQQAGAIVLGDWHANMKSDRLPAGTTAIRLYRRTFELKDDGKLADDTPELLAEKPL